MAIDWGAGISRLGGAVSSIFGGIGDQAEAKGYRTARDLANNQATIAGESTRAQIAQTQRELFKVSGTQVAQTAGAGFMTGGSTGALLRNTATQGALQKEILQLSGINTQRGYEEQAAAYNSMAKAASGGGILGTITGIIKGGLSIASMFGI